MDCKDLIEELRRHGLSNGTSLGWHSGLCDAAADALERMQAQLAEKDRQLAAAVELIDKLERCTYLLDSATEYVRPNVVMRHTLDAATAAIRAWRGQNEVGEVQDAAPETLERARAEGVLYGQVQETVGKLAELLEELEPETRQKMRLALVALAEAVREAAGEVK